MAALKPGENTSNSNIPTKNWMWKNIIVKRVDFFKNLVIFPEFATNVVISAMMKTAMRSRMR